MPADENTLLLIHGDTDIVDVSPSGHPLTAHGYAQASPAKYKFGDGSLWIPGSLNSIGSTDALSNLLAGSTWTIDFWFRYPTVVIGGHQIVGQVNPVNRLGWYVTYTPDVGDGLTGSFSFNMFDSMDSNSGQWLYFYSESCYLAPDT
jgi:hypothetical protein